VGSPTKRELEAAARPSRATPRSAWHLARPQAQAQRLPFSSYREDVNARTFDENFVGWG
jgi:hypothetical protein